VRRAAFTGNLVPYRGSAQAQPDLMAGSTPAEFAKVQKEEFAYSG
jgi:hypothetical protein